MVRQEALCRILVEDLFVSGSNWKMEHQNTLAFLFFFGWVFVTQKYQHTKPLNPKYYCFLPKKKSENIRAILMVDFALLLGVAGGETS